jgi:hypothetical protein
MTIYFSQIQQFILTLGRILWLSVSSAQFYHDVYNSYKGYGIKYVFVLSMIFAFVLSAFLINYNNNLILYFSTGKDSPSLQVIGNFLEEFPTLQYDGKNMALLMQASEQQVSTNNKTFVLDIDNQLTPAEITKIPVVLRKNNVNITLLDNKGKMIENFIINYPDFIGKTPQTIDSSYLKNQMLEIANSMPRIIIYNIFPIASLLIYCNIVFEKIFLIFLLFFGAKFFGASNSFQSAIRVVLFSSGFTVLFGHIGVLLPFFGDYIISAIQLWINFLMFAGIAKDKINITFLKLY